MYKFFSMFAGMAGKIIGSILNAGFEISGLEMFHLNTANAEEFLEVYKGVVGEYAGMVAELKSGPCIALEIRSDSPDTQKNFREFVGPADPVSFFSQLQKRSLKWKNDLKSFIFPGNRKAFETAYFARAVWTW